LELFGGKDEESFEERKRFEGVNLRIRVSFTLIPCREIENLEK